MDFRNLGASGLKVSEFCLGTMTFGSGFMGIGVVDQAGADAIVRAALDAGVNFFDTADVYSRGESEEILGRALENTGVARHSVVVATKVRGTMSDAAKAGSGDVNNRGLGRKHVLESIDASLRRLGIDYVDLYQIHGVDPSTPARGDARGAERRRAHGQGALHRGVQPRRVAGRARRWASPSGAAGRSS